MQNKTWKQTLIEINELKGKLQETINHAIRDFEDGGSGCRAGRGSQKKA